MCLLSIHFQHSPFFSEQLTAFQVWLAMGAEDRDPPEQLPIVLQVLLSQVHRLRALDLLGRFLDLGPWAVNLVSSKIPHFYFLTHEYMIIERVIAYGGSMQIFTPSIHWSAINIEPMIWTGHLPYPWQWHWRKGRVGSWMKRVGGGGVEGLVERNA